MKTIILAAMLLLPTVALAQAPAPSEPPAAAQSAPAAAPRAAPKPKRAPAPKPAAASAPGLAATGSMDIIQILGVRQIDPATYEVDARTQGGGEVHLRMNAFVMQSLGMALGTYGK